MLPRSGISYDHKLELILAAVWAGYAPDYFSETLDVEWQQRILAAYRTHQHIEAVVAHEQARKIKRR